jgi:hypothetical protein
MFLAFSCKLYYLQIGREGFHDLVRHIDWCARITGEAHVRKGTEKPSVCWLVEHCILNDKPNLLIDIGPTKDSGLRVVSYNLVTNGGCSCP